MRSLRLLISLDEIPKLIKNEIISLRGREKLHNNKKIEASFDETIKNAQQFRNEMLFNVHKVEI